ncbi:MAG: VOC family protein [Rhodospirillaceae bacterium]|nr:VOC family protein [Rhodospirillaceae bacterium]
MTRDLPMLSRRLWLSALGGAATWTLAGMGARPGLAQGPAAAKLKRIKMATVGVPDVTAAAAWYSTWLSYVPQGMGKIGKDLAASWGTPAMAGRRQILLQPESGADVFVRLVEIDPVPDYQPLRGYGWNAIELVVENADALQRRLEGTSVQIIGKADALAAGSPIKAMQVLGPGGEVIYLTSHSGDRAKSNHPVPRSAIDRPFIMVVAGPDVGALKSFYRDTFSLGDQGDLKFTVGVLSDALGLPATHIFDLSVLVLAEQGNKLELDGLPPPAGPRPRNAGQLPPGVAMTTFSVSSLSSIDAPFIAPPRALYAGVRAATLVGPAGELIELIEDRK